MLTRILHFCHTVTRNHIATLAKTTRTKPPWCALANNKNCRKTCTLLTLNEKQLLNKTSMYKNARLYG